MPNLQHQKLRREKNTKFITKFTWGKKTPNLQQNFREKSWEKICQIYNINIYMRKNRQIYNIKICVRKTKTPNLQHQILRAKKKHQIYNIKIYVRNKNAKFTTSKFTWEKKTPNLQHENLREKKNAKFTTKFTWEKKTAKFTTSKFTWEKNAKFKTSKFTWKKKTRNSQHHLQHRGQHWTCVITQIEAGARTKLYRFQFKNYATTTTPTSFLLTIFNTANFGKAGALPKPIWNSLKRLWNNTILPGPACFRGRLVLIFLLECFAVFEFTEIDFSSVA